MKIEGAWRGNVNFEEKKEEIKNIYVESHRLPKAYAKTQVFLFRESYSSACTRNLALN